MVCALLIINSKGFNFHLNADVSTYIKRIRKVPKFPNGDDLIASAAALLRLQKTYSLTDVRAIANGRFHDFQLG